MKNLETLIQKLCPDGVEFVKLEEVCKISRGKVYSKKYLAEHIGEYPVYSSQTANDGILGKIGTYDCDGKFLTWTTDGAYAGTVFYRQGKFSVTNVCGLISCSNPILSLKFLYYWLTIEAPKHVHQGMGNPKLMSNQMAKIEIPLPPIEVQTEIVRILDKFTSLEAELEAELDCRKRQYEYYRDKLLSFDNVGWQEVEWKKMSEVCDIITDYVAAGSFAALRENVTYLKGKGYAQLVRTTDLKQNLTNVDDFIYVSKEAYDFLWRVNLNEESVVLPNIGVNCGEVYYITPNMFISDYNVLGPNAIKVRSNNENNHFLYYLFQTPFFQKEINKITSHAGQPKFNKTSLKNIVIPIPSLQEQKRIANLLDRFESLTTSLQSGLPAEIAARRQQYEYYRDKLLTFKHKTA